MSSLRPTPLAGAILASTLALGLAPSARAAEHVSAAPATDAADADDQRPDIVVTGTRDPDANPNADPNAPYKVNKSANEKFTEPLRDTPKTIIAIPKEVIADKGATSFREVVRSTPGVTLGTGEGGNAFGDRIFIRGFEARNDVYIDGLRDPGVTSREIFAVEQIEVVKGPSGAYGGRGTTGGLVSMQSKRPSFGGHFAVIEAGVGTSNFYRTTADVNLTLNDRIAVRVNGLYHNADTPGRDYVNTERYGGTVAVTAKLTDTLSLTGDYYYLRLRGLPDYGVPFDPRTQRPGQVDRNNYFGILARDFLQNDADVATAHLDWQPIAAIKISSVTRYGQTGNRYVVGAPERPDLSSADPSQWTVVSNPKNGNRANRYWANITDATAQFSTGRIAHTLSLGGEFADERVISRPYNFDSINIGTPTNPVYVSATGVPLNYLHPDPTVAFNFPLSAGNATTTDVKSLSAFLIDTVKFTPALQLLLGARYDGYHLDYANPAATGTNPKTLRYDAGFWNWQASFVWKPAKAATLYASFATSTNPSGEQIDGNGVGYDGISAQTVNLAPERNKAWELGAKWEIGDDLLLTAALFRIDKDNARENIGNNVYATVGRLRSQGLELSAAGTIFKRLQLFGGYSYTDATIIASSTPANIGKRFANIPQHSGSLLATWRFGTRLDVGGQIYAQSAIFGGTTVAGSATAPGYARLDAVVKYRLNKRFETRLNVLNLTDKVYYDAIYRSATPFAYIAPGRSAMVTLTGRF